MSESLGRERQRAGARLPRSGGIGDGPDDAPPSTRALRLAEKWARHRRDAVAWGWGIFGEDVREPVVRITHGSSPIYVRDLGKCLMILGVVDLPPELRERLRGGSEGEREEFLQGLRMELTACPRIGFSFAPSDSPASDVPERIALDQTIQIAENEAASFNRFCDAIQETETILLGVEEFLRQALTRSRERPVYSSSSPPPREIYL